MDIINKFLKYSSIAAIFSEAISFHYIIDLKLFYIIIIVNTLILIWIKAIKINIYHLFLIIFITIHGFFGTLLFRYPIQSLIAQIIGISVSSIYFYNLFKHIGYQSLFKSYSYFSLYISIIGLFMFFTGITLWDANRLHGLLNEPSRYVILVLPALYYFFKHKNYLLFLILLCSIILAQSSIGYIGILLLIILPNLKIRTIKKLWFLLPLSIVFLWFLSKNENFQIRYNQTLDAISVFKTKKFDERLNISSYALLSNAFIAFNNFTDHPFGTGLGSYKTAYDRYITQLQKPSYIIKLGQDDINREDANSLFLRMLSDLGVFGLLIIGYFIFLCFKSFNLSSKESIIAQSLVIYFLLKLLRQGHYFPQEFYFFLWAFIFSNIELNAKLKHI